MEQEIEIWKDIPNWEGIYEASSFGRIRLIGKQKIITKSKNYAGYAVATLRKNGVNRQFRVGRLIAETFIPNPENKPFVDHINTIKDDDRVENLRWCTASENIKNPITLSRIKESKMGEKNPNYGKVYDDEYKRKMSDRLKGRTFTQEHIEKIRQSLIGRQFSNETRLKMRNAKPMKKVNQYSKDGLFMKTWECIMDVERTLKIYSQHIVDCCKGKAKSAGGYIWRYAD